MVCGSFIEPLNLECIFVNTLAGSWEIFLIVALLIVAIMSAKFRMPVIVFSSSILLFAIFFYDQAGWLLLTALIVLGVSIGIIISRLGKG